MSKLIWDNISEKQFESGVDHGVIYPISSAGTYPKGTVWNGLISVTESPSGAEETALWADNIKYASLRSAEEYGATIESYMYPKEFEDCNGTVEVAPGVRAGQQTRKAFGFSYRTKIGNDVDGMDHGYKLHLVYNATSSPSQKQHQTVNSSPDAITFSHEVKTTPVPVPGHAPTAHLEIDSTLCDKTKLDALEAILYGTDGSGGTEGADARLPLPAEVAEIMAAAG